MPRAKCPAAAAPQVCAPPRQAHHVSATNVDPERLTAAIQLARDTAAECSDKTRGKYPLPGVQSNAPTLSRKKQVESVAWFEWKEGIDLLDLPMEVVVRYMIKRGYNIDGHMIYESNATMSERINALRYLIKYRALVDRPEMQPLVDLVLFGLHGAFAYLSPLLVGI